MYDYEQKAKDRGFDLIIGVDESGRGPLAGPVVASAVSLKTKKFHSKICDSKKITARQRVKAFHEIFDKAYVGIGIMSETVVDQINILEATFLAMTNAVDQLISQIPEPRKRQKKFRQKVYLLIDGNKFKSDLPYAYKTIIRGDESILSIACASIVAKVTRDRILNAYDQIFPEYGFKRHKGYPTLQHKQAIKHFGLSMIHRKTFNAGFR